MVLIDLLKPAVVVELGTYSGVSYCAFCQAVRELGLECKCYGIDTWTGDRHMGFYGPEVLADLKKYHDPLYGSFSRLIQGTFDESIGRFEDIPVDLLHIDGLHTYEAIRGDFEGWLPRMSRKGVMLFHDTEVRRDDFGVWKFWEEVSQEYPHLEMKHGCGLGMLAIGENLPEPLRVILDSSQEDRVRICEFFRQLGGRVEEFWEAQRLGGQREKRLQELEYFAASIQENPFFKMYHFIKYLGSK